MFQTLKTVALATLLISSGQVGAQFLANPPPPPPTSFEQELAKVTSIPALMSQAQKYSDEKNWKNYGLVMQRISNLRPMAGNMKLELAVAYALQNEKAKGYDTLLRLQTEGYGFDIASDERLKALHGTKVWDYLIAQFNKNNGESGTGKVAYRLPKQDLMLESLAYDPIKKSLLVGSVRDGVVYRIKTDGNLEAFIKPTPATGMWSIFDMAVDAKRKVLWIASSAVPHGKHVKAIDYGRSGLFKFDLMTGKSLGNYVGPVGGKPSLFSNLAVSSTGEAFVVDSVNSEVLRSTEKGLVVVIRNPVLGSLRGLTLDAAGKTLYLADYEQGIFGVDLVTGKAFGLGVPKTISLYGIDGLYQYQNYLVATQNAFPPARVLRMKLTGDGKAIQSFQALDSNRAEFDMPTLGAVAGDKFYFVANSQKDLYDRFGILSDDAKLQSTIVFESDLKFAIDAKEVGALRVTPPAKN